MSDDAHQSPEIIMTAQAKLTDTQTAILKAAAGRADGNIEPLPSNLRGGARAKVIEGLLAKELIEEFGGSHRLTDAGYAAVGKLRPVPKGVQKMVSHDALTKREATSRTIRPGTKLAQSSTPPRRRDHCPDDDRHRLAGPHCPGAQSPAWSGSA